MAPVMACAEVATGVAGMQRGETLSCLTTTLYDLIAVLQEGLSPDDDALVVTTMVHLLRSGRLTWLGQASEPLGLSRHAAVWAMPRVRTAVAEGLRTAAPSPQLRRCAHCRARRGCAGSGSTRQQQPLTWYMQGYGDAQVAT
jgi:hypothetical protein